jgi:hypothetical protein
VITPSDRLESKYILVWKGELPGKQVKTKLDIPLLVFDLYEMN